MWSDNGGMARKQETPFKVGDYVTPIDPLYMGRIMRVVGYSTTGKPALPVGPEEAKAVLCEFVLPDGKAPFLFKDLKAADVEIPPGWTPG